MKVQLHTAPVHYLEITGFYTAKDIEDVMRELRFLQVNDKMKLPSSSGTAMKNFVPLKRNRACFLDQIYADRSVSDIFRINRKIYDVFPQDDEDNKFPDSWFFNTLTPVKDFTLANYYEDGDYYKPHCDTAIATCVSFFHEEPKCWSGGDLVFSDYNHVIQPEVGKMIVFPSMVKHEVTPVTMEDSHSDNGLGRYTISQFLETDTK